MPINSPDVFNPVGDATITGGSSGGAVDKIVAGTNVTISPVNGIGDVTINASGGGGSGTVTSISAGTGIKCSPNPIIATGTVGIDVTGVTSARYIAGNGGFIDVNAQGQITSATEGQYVRTIEVDIPTPSAIAPAGSPITIATAVTGKIFIPLTMLCLCNSGSFTESTKQSLGLFYDASANPTEPIMVANAGMFNLANGNTRCTTGLQSNTFDMTSSPTTKDLELASVGGTFTGNWTGVVIVTGIYHTKV